jgi:hypothetical protein
MEKTYTDFDKLVEDIRDHIANNPDAKIEENDDIARLAVIYTDTDSGCRWRISVQDLDKCINSYPEKKQNTLREAFLSQEGKKAFVEVMFDKWAISWKNYKNSDKE